VWAQRYGFDVVLKPIRCWVRAPHPSPRGVGCGPSTWAQDALAQKVLVASPAFRLERVVQAHKGVGYRPNNWAHDHGLGLNHVFKVYYRLRPIKSIFFLKILINFWSINSPLIFAIFLPKRLKNIFVFFNEILIFFSIYI